MGKMKELFIELEREQPANYEIDEDYAIEQFESQSTLTEQYWQAKAEETMDRINAYYDTRFCTADVEAAVAEVTKDEKIISEVTHKLNEIYLRRQVMNVQLNG
jgi:SpoVK/Ycf46/Vps4 family AAA+-type ATPase